MPHHSRVTRRLGLKAALSAAAALPLTSTAPSASAAPAAPEPSRELEVMSFNLRFASTTEPNSWAVRRPVLHALLDRAAPHVIGTQEGLFPQLLDIASDLGPRYDWIGTGRLHGSHDEFMAVFYDTQRLTPTEYDHFWLSDTPDVIGSNTWGAALPRMVTWVRFRDRYADGQEFHLLNTHFDHASQSARERSAALVAERVRSLDGSLPLVVTGDFNVAAHSNPVHDTLLAAGLADTWDTAGERSPLYGTFHGYEPLTPDGDRIDWILTTPGVTTRRVVIDTFSADGRFPSDHLPVRASLTLG
ncbi:endonuclease/exonuclease/phosphatase family protein [Streptomyces sp. MMS24-I2-30]|uniref:endonuclease/exonuclease/phosphatase family protein n=1 Tax=Streptomyces sp. MMS24-I2-30 TaxID=3351564 RepID=UPI003896BDB3